MDPERYNARLLPETRVLFRIRGTPDCLMTNDTGPQLQLLRVFCADLNGKVSMEGYLLGSIFAQDPELIPDLEEVDRPFGELALDYFRRDPAVDGLLGLAVGDAFGVPYEFLSRREIALLPLGEMLGCEDALPFASRWGSLIPRGAWSDDTSMTVAAMSSVVQKQGQIDYDDIMRQFLLWCDKGLYCSIDQPFGLGRTVGDALRRYRYGKPALRCGGVGVRDNGNGALMRIFPFSIWCVLRDLDDTETLAVVRQGAQLTHGHEIAALSCYLYTLFLRECLRTRSPQLAYGYVFAPFRERSVPYAASFSPEAIEAHSVFREHDLRETFDTSRIRESGYVVDSLVAAVYSLLHSESYEGAVKAAVRLGYDTDTNAAIVGSIAGAMYGREQIPARWLQALRRREDLIRLGERFSRCVRTAPVAP
ncbi:MAG: ADP-ribosylglycohydrolase family protein [Oscillospiraceae bacterium]|nr:ADP-ribosylglycohydrolase family protein [Oscillospiraceae bacterium]